MNAVIFLVGFVGGLLTLGFIVNVVVQHARGKAGGSARTFLVVTFLSLLTAAFTAWQLVLALGQVPW